VGTPRRSAAADMMRMLAWCITSQSISCFSMPALASAASITCRRQGGSRAGAKRQRSEHTERPASGTGRGAVEAPNACVLCNPVSPCQQAVAAQSRNPQQSPGSAHPGQSNAAGTHRGHRPHSKLEHLLPIHVKVPEGALHPCNQASAGRQQETGGETRSADVVNLGSPDRHNASHADEGQEKR
jgi:hypothetical protein